MTSPRACILVPSSFVAHRGSRVVLLGMLLSMVCFGRAAAAPGSASPAGSKHEKPYALIFGTVWGPDNHPLCGVKVKIRRADQKKAHWELASDHNGEFALRVPAGQGDYLVWADLKGYKSPGGKQLQPTQEVRVHIENDERANIGLHLE
ncbi:MAG: hypothetical protein AUG13_03650 [Chloroflexi bacterium 13_1_20CM_2_59_7]|nr:MAG: hypothetical protein AUG13_03650 [Chloroflexi bacterium 13_1_20CM_2_59_7]